MLTGLCNNLVSSVPSRKLGMRASLATQNCLCLAGFFFCLQGEFLFVFDLFLFYLLVEVAPVAARDDELVDLELRMNALCPVKQISVERILRGKPDAG